MEFEEFERLKNALYNTLMVVCVGILAFAGYVLLMCFPWTIIIFIVLIGIFMYFYYDDYASN